MSILSGKEILREIEKGRIRIDPFDPACVGPNSVDLRLDWRLLVLDAEATLDPENAEANSQAFREVDLRRHPDGYVVRRGDFVLASTIERTFCEGYVPLIETKSRYARCGLSMHESAGFGDNGFRGTWTLEISPKASAVLRYGRRVCQVHFSTIVGDCDLYDGHFQDQKGPTILGKELRADEL